MWEIKQGRLDMDLFLRLRSKKEIHCQWKQRQVTWGEYRDTVHMSRNGVRKAKAKLEQDLARDVRNYKKGFHKDIGQKRPRRV